MASVVKRELIVEEKKRRELENLDHWYRKQRSLARHAVEDVMLDQQYRDEKSFIEKKYSQFFDPIREMKLDAIRYTESRKKQGVLFPEKPKRRRDRKRLTTFINIED